MQPAGIMGEHQYRPPRAQQTFMLKWRLERPKQFKARRFINQRCGVPYNRSADNETHGASCRRCKASHSVPTSVTLLRRRPRIVRSVGTAGPDPFRYRRCEDDDPFVQQILQDSITWAWANIIPIEASPGKYPIIHTFLEFMYRNDAAYYTYVYCCWVPRRILAVPVSLRSNARGRCCSGPSWERKRK
jgi:hypothetical protein